MSVIAVWTVQNSSGCDASINRFVAYFRSRRDRYNLSPDTATARQLADEMAEFGNFLKRLKKFENEGKPTIEPNHQLAYVQQDASGLPVYSLCYENWRCLYLVNKAVLTCTATKVENMSRSLRYVEEDRHSTDRFLLRFR